ncbi:hypothetical protein ONZ45_g10581 [Pleurotus djamor]|nr:hypothetical protein ONZ45_g10581 [Pleurotus djamor]
MHELRLKASEEKLEEMGMSVEDLSSKGEWVRTMDDMRQLHPLLDEAGYRSAARQARAVTKGKLALDGSKSKGVRYRGGGACLTPLPDSKGGRRRRKEKARGASPPDWNTPVMDETGGVEDADGGDAVVDNHVAADDGLGFGQARRGSSWW